jgi:hypothetical protein
MILARQRPGYFGDGLQHAAIWPRIMSFSSSARITASLPSGDGVVCPLMKSVPT